MLTTTPLPAHVGRVLDSLQGVVQKRDGWDALCPCPDHNRDGDQHPSLRISIGEDGRILIKCRAGCTTDAVLDAIALDWGDLFGPVGLDEALPVPTIRRPESDQAAPSDQSTRDLYHEAYELLLASLSLADEHREDLRRRGLDDQQIDYRGYRTLRNTDRGRAARAVHEQLGDQIFTVPGFDRGEFGVTLAGTATGLVVPVRDLQGRVLALKVRRATEPKYVYLTSDSGPSPGSPVHVPLGVQAPASEVRVTEGEIKSDVCVALDKTPTIGVPGITQWRPAIPVLRAMQAQTVVLAYDALDMHTKPPVFEQAEAFGRELQNQGFQLEVEDW